MKKLLFFLFFAVVAHAQTHRFIYEVQYKKDSTENVLTKEYFHLDINKDEIKYYGRDYYIMDSITKTHGALSAPPSMSNVIVAKENDDKYDEYELLEYEVLKLTDSPKQNWKLSRETKTVAGLQMQKATTDWARRHWTAWFTKDIPFSFGPYKFHGLPGLITEIFDDKGNFKFNLVKSENLKETQEVHTIEKFPNVAPASWQQYRAKKLSTYADPLGFIKSTEVNFNNGTEGIFLKDGTKVTPENIREVTIQQRKSIKKYNNPIELDKAIHYPEK